MWERSTCRCIVVLSVLWSVSSFELDDGSLFRLDFLPFADLVPETSESRPVVEVRSSKNELFVCSLPEANPSSASASEEAGLSNAESATATAMELLKPLLQPEQTAACAYKLDHYWTYELCHGKHLRQFHEEREGRKVETTEYFLGRYNAGMYAADVKRVREQELNRKPRKLRLETLELAYVEVEMVDGSVCDLNNRPRITHVYYVCFPGAKNEMYSLKESSTCEYEVIVLTSLLCSHADFRSNEAHEHAIECVPKHEKQARKPRELVKWEAENLLSRHTNFPQPVDDVPADIFDHLIVDVTKAKKPAIRDPDMVRRFLLGEYCLYGGSGWWRYEFCYGVKVDQYHSERQEDKKNVRVSTINLGNFDMVKHKEWLKNHPTKRPKPVSARKQVSHFYSGGEFCDEAKKPREVEVRLKCKEAESISSVSLYLLEPRTCEYILGVESPLVCDILHLADDDGLMAITEEDLDQSSWVSIDIEEEEETLATEEETVEYEDKKSENK